MVAVEVSTVAGMDLIPRPDQVVAAASNVVQRARHGGLADLRPLPRDLIAKGMLRELHHYRPTAGVAERGDPVLLVAPLAAPARSYDLRRGCSLVEHLVAAGRPTYLVEYGEVSFREHDLTMEKWVADVVPTAIREASAYAGDRPVHVVGWSLGGIFALLAAADDPGLPIASLTLLGTPFDVTQVPMVAPLRPLLDLTDGRGVLPRVVRAAGETTALARWAAQQSKVHKLLTKPLAIARSLDDTDFLAQVEAVDRLRADTTAYRGRSFGQLYHRFVKANAIVDGRFELGDRSIELANVTAPVLLFGGATDRIAPIDAVKAVVPLLTGVGDVRFEVVPGGHLGQLTGRAARRTTWPVMDEWFDRWSAGDAREPTTTPPAAKRPPRKRPARKSSGSQTSAGGSIGTNPERRYRSAASRRLAP